jgi:hypothetical protein
MPPSGGRLPPSELPRDVVQPVVRQSRARQEGSLTRTGAASQRCTALGIGNGGKPAHWALRFHM